MKLPKHLILSLFIYSFFLIFPAFSYATDFGYGSMAGYYTLSEVYDQLDNMYSKYPNLITQKESIGTTSEGRPLYVVKISDNPNADEDEPEVFYNSLIHAREPMGMEVTIYYMYYLLENYATDSTIEYLVNNREMYFLPVVNPDGYYYNQTTNPTGGGNWRKNRRDNGDGSFGVDINRNFGPFSYWDYDNAGSSTTPSSGTYRGTAPYSEPESAAINAFLSSHQIKTALNFHSGWFGTDIFPSFKSGVNLNDLSILREWAIDMNQDSDYQFGDTTKTINSEARGDIVDYMYDGEIPTIGKIYSFAPELIYINWSDQSYILPKVIENISRNKYMAFVAGGYTDLVSTSIESTYIDPGEFIQVLLNVKNKGLNTANQVVASLTSDSQYITIINGTNSIRELTSQESLTINNAFSFSVSESVPLGEEINFTITISENGKTINTHTLTHFIASPKIIFSTDCNDMVGWTTSSAQTTTWDITTESYHSSPSSCTDSPNANYSHYHGGLSNSIISSTINLNGYTSPKLSFWLKYEIQPIIDYGMVQISIDDGATWTTLSGIYDRDGTLFTPTSPESIYTGTQDVWKKEEIDLSSYSGQQVKLKFLLTSVFSENSTISYLERDGWYIDDIRVFEYNEILSDIFNPNREWINVDGNTVRFASNGSDNLYTISDRPEFNFKRTTDNTAGISSYEILIQPKGKDYYTYISNIENKSDGEIVDTDTKYVKYSRDDIFVYSKKESDHLTTGAYKWKVRVVDNNGNSIESDAKILRINTHEANFSTTF